jgi:hypothetical protein
VRLSVKKAAYADLSRAACRKSGGVLGRILTARTSHAGTAENFPGRQSWVSFFAIGTLIVSQDLRS